jgi:hypothetical protein
MTRQEGTLSTADVANAQARTDTPATMERRETEGHDARTALFLERDAADFRKRWTDTQTAFVDEPRSAVQKADALVADVMKRLAESFASERSTLESQWDRGDSATTEDLRVALQRYRSFFDRLLAV